MGWLPSLFSGYGILMAVIIIIAVTPIFMIIDRLVDGNIFIALGVSVIIYAITFTFVMQHYRSGFLKLYKNELYEHYDEYEEYIENVDDISAEDVGGIYPYMFEPYVLKGIGERAEDSSFLKLVTVNMNGKTSKIVLWDQCAEYKEVTDDSIEESYYQLYKDDDEKIVILEKHIGTNGRTKESKEPKKITQS